MGWSYGWNTRRELVSMLTEQNEWTTKDNVVHKRTLLKSCYKGAPWSGVLWTVWEVSHRHSDAVEPHMKQWYIGCDLMQYYKKDGWGYKDMDESMGPYYYNCPLSYLDLVPVANEDWRKHVRAYHVKLQVGLKVKLRNCSIDVVEITSVKPLKCIDMKTHITYKLQRRLIDSVITV